MASISTSVDKTGANRSEPYFHTLSYLLSRTSFVVSHLVFVYWLNYITNDPFGTGLFNTLDVKKPLPPGQCTQLDSSALLFDVLLIWGIWWGSHSLLARKAAKVALGLWQHPIERPLFAFVAPFTWLATLVLWRPVSNCSSFNVFEVPASTWAVSGLIFAAGTLQLLALFYSLPDHVFGVSRYQYRPGTVPKPSGIIEKIPYNLVRHPAAAGFLWMYWSLPSYTTNHLVLALFWTVFIVVGTLAFEEGDLRGPDEFGQEYVKYASRVNAFWPSSYSIKRAFGAETKSKSS